MEGWWCVRHGDALAWVEAPMEAVSVRRSLELHPLGDWTDDARERVAFHQDAYSDHSRPHACTRAVLDANPALPRRRRAGPRGGRSGAVLDFLAAVLLLGLGIVSDASADTWRGLTVAPEHRCAPYDKKRHYPYPQSVERDIVRELGAVYGPYTAGASHPPPRRTSNISWLPAKPTIPVCAQRTPRPGAGSRAT